VNISITQTDFHCKIDANLNQFNYKAGCMWRIRRKSHRRWQLRLK